ncbi:MAG: hypothetical protein ACFCVF_00530 [Kineosporiaceae bacterium]
MTDRGYWTEDSGQARWRGVARRWRSWRGVVLRLRSPRRVAVVGAAVVVVLVTAVLVGLRVARSGHDEAGVSDPAVAAALAFAAATTTTDPDARSRAIGRWVVPHRVPEFVEAFDETFGERERRQGSVTAAPRGYRVVERSSTVAVVLVWSEVTTAAGTVGGEISGYGVIAEAGRWWVFSYEGTAYDVPEGDPRLGDFTDVATVTAGTSAAGPREAPRARDSAPRAPAPPPPAAPR